MKRFATILLALVMILSLTIGAAAQEVDSGKNGSATITITNASRGETYAVYKLFDATVTGTADGSIAYTGEIPDSLAEYFTKDAVGNISLAEGVDETALFVALKAWADSEETTATAEAVSDGSELTFKNLEYGYYVVTTTQGDAAITVTSTNPNATIVDKNSTPPGTELNKDADHTDVNIGDTVTYTISFNTSNYEGAGKDAKQIISYTIADTLPEFLADVTVTSIIVDNDGELATTDDQTNVTEQFADKKITIDWATANGTDPETYTSLYENGAKVVITYTATVADVAVIDGNGNKNAVTLTWKYADNTDGGGDSYKTDETIFTYAIALKKVDQAGDALAGAIFQLPFYVKATPAADGAYIYAGTEAGEGLTNTLTTPESGLIIIKGVQSGVYSITETRAPDGYNKLTAPVEVTATKTGKTETSTTVYLDKDGNIVDSETEGGSTVLVTIDKLAATAVVVVNKTGSVLPETGGMGTTMFYLFGGMLVLASVVLLVTKKRMTNVE